MPFTPSAPPRPSSKLNRWCTAEEHGCCREVEKRTRELMSTMSDNNSKVDFPGAGEGASDVDEDALNFDTIGEDDILEDTP